ncbi:MAG: NADH:ubiquinone oxidoreductase subunit NDUFA12 [Alphaproteobacteria bacterium]|nr:NADH:ubiquinone oxidoreductase subunit NDUFA12 [Alphaproteobacteria bacterium]QQS57710.1 MAG: NADH:ubiquinone oxidoreductase subunit NDUFA12 [Alphaproteobacteria bacterium]
MGFLSFFGAQSPAYTMLITLFSSGKKVGTDPYGNRYYEAKPRKGYKYTRRWVVYQGEAEASKVPPEWHGWLHHQTDALPRDDAPSFRRTWQQPHQPNMTGTTGAYRPPGHILQGGRRDKATGDYEAWTPPD